MTWRTLERALGSERCSEGRHADDRRVSPEK
jgi:hypothetical protein